MKEKENAARAGAVQGAEAHAETGTAAPYGKFASADALLQAYNSLEAEFTRRSQRLRELEGRLAASAGAADAAQPAGGGEGGAEAPAKGQSPAEAPARKESVSEEIAREAMRLASHKLPVKCKFVKKETAGTENTAEGGEV